LFTLNFFTTTTNKQSKKKGVSFELDINENSLDKNDGPGKIDKGAIILGHFYIKESVK
jgi:hypothetical protein